MAAPSGGRVQTAPQLGLRISAQPTGRSHIAGRRVSWPWSLPRGFYMNGLHGPLTVLPQCAAAGLLPGDHWRHDLQVDNHAGLRFVEAGATVVHAGKAPPGVVDWRISVGAGATLALFGQPFVLLPRARLHQTFDITLHDNAIAIISDGMCLSTAAPDGQSWQSTLCVKRADGLPILREAQQVDGAGLARIAACHGQTHGQSHGQSHGPARAFASIMVFAPADVLADLLGELQDFVRQLKEGYGACGMLRAKQGIGLRLVCGDGGALTRAMNAAQDKLERRFFG
ncbi:urease accessory protein UreD [Rhodalgimonas zhirmunskyi]|uniref:Urease accessory protein UreD n=1 Tax=Rhodalgimonas zhirmunskyi TaxID=2964767 RepID=A0AAJ1U894_9RHOB|nr:urease accessory protein UreD [Rhodoalgimonas zhirmunskyi]MDQ2093585.1 urease accessory protein UreD [Rhodoalgimonas zhirmunskyi]